MRIVYVKFGDAIDSQYIFIVLEGSNSDNSNSSKQQQLQRQHQYTPVAAYAHRSTHFVGVNIGRHEQPPLVEEQPRCGPGSCGRCPPWCSLIVSVSCTQASPLLEVGSDVTRCSRAASTPRFWVSKKLYHREANMATLLCLRAAKKRRSCNFLYVSLWYRRMWHFSGCGHCGGIRCGMADGTRASAFTRRLVSGGNHRDLLYVNNYLRGLLVWYISISCHRRTFPIILAMVAAIT